MLRRRDVSATFVAGYEFTRCRSAVYKVHVAAPVPRSWDICIRLLHWSLFLIDIRIFAGFLILAHLHIIFYILFQECSLVSLPRSSIIARPLFLFRGQLSVPFPRSVFVVWRHRRIDLWLSNCSSPSGLWGTFAGLCVCVI